MIRAHRGLHPDRLLAGVKLVSTRPGYGKPDILSLWPCPADDSCCAFGQAVEGAGVFSSAG